jgi:protein-tyrosine phosphatase
VTERNRAGSSGSSLFRRVDIPDVLGCLYLHAMPGRHEALSRALEEIDLLRITHVVSLASIEEIRVKSPEYALLLERGPGWSSLVIPVPDFGVPEDEGAFNARAREAAELLRSGENLLVHCGAGIGRTGTFAICVLRELGFDPGEASRAVLEAGSRPETPEQQALCTGPVGRAKPGSRPAR